MSHEALYIKRFILILILSISFIPCVLLGQSTDAKISDNSSDMDEEAYLEWVSTTGKLLHSYYQSYQSVRDTLNTLYGEVAISPIYGVEHSDDGFVFGFGAYNKSSFMMKYRVSVSKAGFISQIESFEDSTRAIGEIAFTAQALHSSMLYFEQSSLQKPLDDSKYRRAVLIDDYYQYLVIFSPQQLDDEYLLFGGEYAFWVEKITGQFISHKPWHKRVTRMSRTEYPGRLPVLLDKELAYLTPVDVALTIENDQAMPFLMGFGSYYVFRDGRVERLSDDDPMANPRIRAQN